MTDLTRIAGVRRPKDKFAEQQRLYEAGRGTDVRVMQLIAARPSIPHRPHLWMENQSTDLILEQPYDNLLVVGFEHEDMPGIEQGTRYPVRELFYDSNSIVAFCLVRNGQADVLARGYSKHKIYGKTGWDPQFGKLEFYYNVTEINETEVI